MLDERVLQGLRETKLFRSANWSDGSSIQIMKEIVELWQLRELKIPHFG